MNAQQTFEKIENEHPELHPIIYRGVHGRNGEVTRITVISTPETKEYLKGLGFDDSPFPRCDFKLGA